MTKLLFFLMLALIYVAECADVRKFGSTKMFVKDDDVTVITDEDGISFFVIGDWGGLPTFPYRTNIEKMTSKLMNELSQTYNTKFQLAIGDNFYFTGVKDVDDKRFLETYEDVFNTEYLRESPWFVLLGNHDHYGNASAQLDYSKRSKRWIIPSFNYTIDVDTKNGKETLISIMMLDTVLMCGNSPYQGAGQPMFASLEAKHAAADYWSDFEQRLATIAASSVPYIIVSGHFPVWSVAEHGPTQCLVDKLRPLLHKYNVSAYFSGHDHNLQHIRDEYLGHTIDYVVSGASNFIDDDTSHMTAIPPSSLQFHWADKSKIVNGGFVVAQATRQNITLTFFETTGKTLYQTVVRPRF